MFTMIKEAMEIDKKYKKRVLFKSIPIIVIILAICLLCLISIASLTKIAHTQPYIKASLIDVEVYSFENTIDNKMININGKWYQLPASNFPAHTKNGDTFTLAVDANGNILGSEAYIIDGQLYKDGHAVNTEDKLKEVTFDEYVNETALPQKDAAAFRVIPVFGLIFSLIGLAVYIFYIHVEADDIIKDKEFMDMRAQAPTQVEPKLNQIPVSPTTPPKIQQTKKRGRPRKIDGGNPVGT